MPMMPISVQATHRRPASDRPTVIPTTITTFSTRRSFGLCSSKCPNRMLPTAKMLITMATSNHAVCVFHMGRQQLCPDHKKIDSAIGIPVVHVSPDAQHEGSRSTIRRSRRTPPMGSSSGPSFHRDLRVQTGIKRSSGSSTATAPCRSLGLGFNGTGRHACGSASGPGGRLPNPSHARSRRTIRFIGVLPVTRPYGSSPLGP